MIGWKAEIEALAKAVAAAEVEAALAEKARPKTLMDSRRDSIVRFLSKDKGRIWCAAEISAAINVGITTTHDLLRTLALNNRIIRIPGTVTSRGQIPNQYKGI